jgi:hypothetical protein
MVSKLRAGKGYEITVVGMLIEAGLDVYLPTVDDRRIDALIRLKCDDGSIRYHEVQVKGSQTWNGIRGKITDLHPNTILILYCAKERKILWFMSDELPMSYSGDSPWGNIFLKASDVEHYRSEDRHDLNKLVKRLTGNTECSAVVPNSS